MTQNLIEFIKKHINPSPNSVNIEKLFGQASSRQYYRASFDDQSLVIMQLPKGFSSPAEEITKINPEAPKEFPFINIQKYLNHLGINVPKIFAQDDEQGLILLEDLGDQSLEKQVQNVEGEFFVFYYKKVIDTLIDLQNKTLENPSKDCVAFYRSFDQDLLHWEFMHFLEYAIEDYYKIKVPDDDKNQYSEITKNLAKMITQMPQGFVHRDFQSRNLMFKNYHYYLIDFQDALKGSVLYDLVALLRDSYINITPQICQTLLDYYHSNLPTNHPYYNNTDQFMRDFHLVSLHRKLKDTGRFQYIDTVRKNPNFLVHIPQSLEYIKDSFQKLIEMNVPQVQDLYQLVCKYVKELN